MLGQEWKFGKSDCLAVCVELLRRAGMKDAAESLTQCASTGMANGHWKELPSQSRLLIGDIVMSESKVDDNLQHALAVCDASKSRVVSASKVHGVYITRISKVRGFTGVYRYES